MNSPSVNEAEVADEPRLSKPDTGSGIYKGVQGIGPTLRALREAKHVSLADASSRLKFSVRQFEALEAERWERLPQGVSLRGFVKNYARFLDADVAALVTMLEHQVDGTGAKPTAIGEAQSLSGGTDIPMRADSAPRAWGWLIIIVLILLVAGFYAIERGWIPDSWLVFDWLRSLKK